MNAKSALQQKQGTGGKKKLERVKENEKLLHYTRVSFQDLLGLLLTCTAKYS